MKPSSSDDAVVVAGDIADRKTAERAISEGMARFGRIDTLVNNAGIFIAKPRASTSAARCRQYLRLMSLKRRGPSRSNITTTGL
jgi:NAD(P)-dependent dehydrogenase (short-subunit alcohol dehydrogenase family)